MKNKLFEEALQNVPEETHEKVKAYTDAIDLAVEFGDWILSNYQTVVTGINKKQWTNDSRDKFTTSELFQIYINYLENIQNDKTGD